MIINISEWKEDLSQYIKMAKKTTSIEWEDRTVDITDDPIVQRVIDKLNNDYNLDTKCLQSQIQTLPIGSESKLHKHDDNGREDSDINVLIYLNDEYGGGEFCIRNWKIKPFPGMMVCFNGQEELHGVTPVTGAQRYGLIFWLKKG